MAPRIPGGIEPLEWSSHASPIGAPVNGVVAVGNSILAVVAEEGIYRSSNAGSTWVLLSSYPSTAPWTEPLALAECDGAALIANGGSVLRSLDLGDGWDEIRTDALWALASSGRTVLGLEFDGSAYLSRDCGAAWEPKGRADPIARSAAHVERETWLSASVTAGVGITHDDGQTWSLSLALPGAATTFVSSSGRAFGAARTGGFFYTDDMDEWVELPGAAPGLPAFAEYLAEPAPGVLYHAYDIALSRSIDGGNTWERTAWTASDRISGLASLDGSLYVGAEDGVWKISGDELPRRVGPRRLNPARAGVTSGGRLFIGARIGPLTASVFALRGGAWSAGLFREVLLSDWAESGSLGLLLALRSIEEPGLGRIVRSVDGGDSWSVVLQGVEPGALLIRNGVAFAFVDALLEMTPGAGRGGIWRSVDGSTWQRMPELPVSAPYEARDLAAVPGHGIVLLVGGRGEADESELWLLRDGGGWRSSETPGNDALVGIGTLPGSRLIAVTAGSVHVSDDAGASWAATAVPDNGHIRGIASGAGYVAIATSQGLYGGEDGSSWRRIHPEELAFTSVDIALDGTVVATTESDVHMGRTAN